MSATRTLSLAVLSMWCLSILYSASDVHSYESSECFYVEQEWCTNALEAGKYCDTKITSDTRMDLAFCCNITTEKQIQDFITSKKDGGRALSGIHIRDSNLTTLNVNIFHTVRSLASLTITNSYINRLIGSFGDTGLTCLNISMNSIVDMNTTMILELAGLKNLVIRNNTNITTFPLLPYSRSFIELDLSGNYNMACNYLVNLTETIFKSKIKINQVNKNLTICLPPEVYFHNPYHVRMEQIDLVEEIYKNCPTATGDRNCSCSANYLDFDEENGTVVYQALVNCSGQGLSALPKILPPYTRVLDVSNNKITSLEGIGNSSYDNISHLYANNNEITSLGPLEGSKFLDYFQNLSLARNKIEQIPTHIFMNVFDRHVGIFLSLAHNVLKCDCSTATFTKIWLMNVRHHVTDYDEVYAKCDETRSTKVIDMDEKDYCVSSNFGSYLKYLIVAEVSVFILLVCKMSYDYHVFKTHGYLPWPASRMPKLPCDWCFET